MGRSYLSTIAINAISKQFFQKHLEFEVFGWNQNACKWHTHWSRFRHKTIWGFQLGWEILRKNDLNFVCKMTRPKGLLVPFFYKFQHDNILVNHICHCGLCSYLDKRFVMPFCTFIWFLLPLNMCVALDIGPLWLLQVYHDYWKFILTNSSSFTFFGGLICNARSMLSLLEV